MYLENDNLYLKVIYTLKRGRAYPMVSDTPHRCVYDPELSKSIPRGPKPIWEKLRASEQCSDPRSDFRVAKEGKRAFPGNRLPMPDLASVSRPKNEINRCLISGIGPFVTVTQLKDAIRSFGTVIDAGVLYSKDTGASLCLAWCKFKTPKDAANLVDIVELNPAKLMLASAVGMSLRVQLDDRAKLLAKAQIEVLENAKREEAAKRAAERAIAEKAAVERAAAERAIAEREMARYNENRTSEDRYAHPNDILQRIELRRLSHEQVAKWFSMFLGETATYIFIRDGTHTPMEFKPDDIARGLRLNNVKWSKISATRLGYYISFASEELALHCYTTMHRKPLCDRAVRLGITIRGRKVRPEEVVRLKQKYTKPESPRPVETRRTAAELMTVRPGSRHENLSDDTNSTVRPASAVNPDIKPVAKSEVKEEVKEEVKPDANQEIRDRIRNSIEESNFGTVGFGNLSSSDLAAAVTKRFGSSSIFAKLPSMRKRTVKPARQPTSEAKRSKFVSELRSSGHEAGLLLGDMDVSVTKPKQAKQPSPARSPTKSPVKRVIKNDHIVDDDSESDLEMEDAAQSDSENEFESHFASSAESQATPPPDPHLFGMDLTGLQEDDTMPNMDGIGDLQHLVNNHQDFLLMKSLLEDRCKSISATFSEDELHKMLYERMRPKMNFDGWCPPTSKSTRLVPYKEQSFGVKDDHEKSAVMAKSMLSVPANGGEVVDIHNDRCLYVQADVEEDTKGAESRAKKVARVVAARNGKSFFRDQLTRFGKEVRLARSAIHDWGLYAAERMEAGDFIMEYVGEALGSDLADAVDSNYVLDGRDSTYMFRLDDELVIDATVRGNASRFMNHSCAPNCETRICYFNNLRCIALFALRDIDIDEELTFDYKFEVASQESERIRCACGATTCKYWLC